MATRGSSSVRFTLTLLLGLGCYGGGAYALLRFDLWKVIGAPISLPPTALLVTSTVDDNDIYAALHAGARGILLKNIPPEQMTAAVTAAARGNMVFSPGNSTVAKILHISEATVKTHLNRAMGKLEISSRAQAVALSYEFGLVIPRQRVAGPMSNANTA